MNQTETFTANRAMLRRFVEEEAETLLGTLRYYLLRAGLADGQGATLAAVELLNEVVIEALEHADRFRRWGHSFCNSTDIPRRLEYLHFVRTFWWRHRR